MKVTKALKEYILEEIQTAYETIHKKQVKQILESPAVVELFSQREKLNKQAEEIDKKIKEISKVLNDKHGITYHRSVNTRTIEIIPYNYKNRDLRIHVLPDNYDTVRKAINRFFLELKYEDTENLDKSLATFIKSLTK